MRTLCTLAVLVCGCLFLRGVAIAQEKDKSPDELRRTKEDLARRLYGGDRDARRKAAWEAIKIEHELGVDFFVKLLEARFATADEEEEAMYWGAYALGRLGGDRALPWLDKLRRRPPQVTRTVKSEKGQDQVMAAYPYQTEAQVWWEQWVFESISDEAVRRAKALPAPQGADLLVSWLMDPAASFAAIRRPTDPEKIKMHWWEGRLSHLVCGHFGAEGVRAMARAIEKAESAEMRGQLCDHLREDFFTECGNTDADKEHRRKLRADPAARAGAVAAVRAVLRRTACGPDDCRGRDVNAALGLANWLAPLVELEHDLITFAESNRTGRPCPKHPGRGCGGGGNAVVTLAGLKTDRALDYAVSYEAVTPDPGIYPEGLLPRYMSWAERQGPTDPRLGHLVDGLSERPSWARLLDAAQIERIRARLQAALPGIDPKDKVARERAEENLASAKRAIERVKAAPAVWARIRAHVEDVRRQTDPEDWDERAERSCERRAEHREVEAQRARERGQ